MNDARVATDAWRMKDYLSRIEIVANGSDVIKSIPADIMDYLAWRDGAALNLDQHHNYGTSTLRYHGYVLFGRQFGDPEYGLDLSRFTTTELRVTNVATSSYFSADLSMDVLLYILRDHPPASFKGYLRTELWRTYTTVASDVQYIDLPTKGALRRLVLQAVPPRDSDNLATATPYSMLPQLRLTLKDGHEELFNDSLRELWYQELARIGRDPIVGLESYHTDGKGIRTGLGQAFAKAGVYLSHDGTQSTYAPDLTPGLDADTQSRQSEGDADQFSLIMLGVAPENCVSFDFDWGGNPANWLSLPNVSTVQLEVHVGTSASHAGGTVNVVTDRLIVY